MRILKFTIWLGIGLALIFALNNSWGQIPALGYLLSPSHGFWQQMEADKPNLSSEITTNELKAPVQVLWDENLVPHITAQNDEDLYFVQGYVTAQMRLWQMDFTARAAAGRISEVVGDAALEYDKRMRRKGMLIGASKSHELTMADETTRIQLESYAQGVNAYIKTLNAKTLPLEYKLLDMQPEEWSSYKSMLLLVYMANMLNSFNKDIENTNFLAAYGYEDWAMLFAGRDDKKEPIVNAPGSWNLPAKSLELLPEDVVLPPVDLIDEFQANPENGSNNWAVDGQKSATGNAILANDPHLGLNLPALWFLVHLNNPNLNVMGASLPGTSGIVIGFNENIAWGFTNAQRDMVDWYEVEFTNAKRNEILVDGEAVAITPTVEEIKVKNGNSVFDTIYNSPFGVIANYSKLTSNSKTKGIAYRWLGQDASGVAIALSRLNRGTNKDDYLQASDYFTSPGQNIIYADVQGNIGIRVQGQYLLRQENEGLFMRKGNTLKNAWNNFIPLSENIIQINPERGFVSSANQYPVDTTYPYFIAASVWQSYRNRRINAVLTKDTSVTVADMKALHSDNYNLEAEENLKYWLAALNYPDLNAEEQTIFNKLMNWNFFSNPEMAEPAYYNSWRDAIINNAWDEMNSSEKKMPYPTSYRTFKLLKEQPELQWWDIKVTNEIENAEALIRYAFKQAISELDMWTEKQVYNKRALNWGNVKATQLTHLSRQLALSQQNVFIGGNYGIVNATSEKHGPSWRQVVELHSNGVKAWGIFPGGQSGNPGSQFYINFTDRWAKGEYLDLNLRYTQSSTTLLNCTFKPLPK